MITVRPYTDPTKVRILRLRQAFAFISSYGIFDHDTEVGSIGIHKSDDKLDVCHVEVFPEHRGKKYGQRGLRRLIESWPRRSDYDAPHFWLCCKPSLIPYYAAIGFKETTGRLLDFVQRRYPLPKSVTVLDLQLGA